MQRPVPLRVGSAAVGVSGWREIAEATVRSNGVVVVLPERQSLKILAKPAWKAVIAAKDAA